MDNKIQKEKDTVVILPSPIFARIVKESDIKKPVKKGTNKTNGKTDK